MTLISAMMVHTRQEMADALHQLLVRASSESTRQSRTAVDEEESAIRCRAAFTNIPSRDILGFGVVDDEAVHCV